MGDFNARVQVKQDDTEIAIGPYTFDPHNNLIQGQSETAAGNRQRFIASCNAHELHITKTQFQKPDIKLETYAEMGVRGAPFNRDRCEMIDYILIPTRGRNTIKNIETYVTHNIETRHMPVIAQAHITMTLARQSKRTKGTTEKIC